MATFDSSTKIWDGPKINPPFSLRTSIGGEILKKLAETPDRVLHICHDEAISMTCEATRIASIRVAQNLSRLGIRKGDVIGFICTNSIKLPELIYGCLLLGAPINPLDIGFKKDDIKHMFEQTHPKLVFCDSAVYETVKLSLDEIGSNVTIITLRESITGVHYVDELLTETGNEAFFEIPDLGDSRETLAVILCSSGTTGDAKGVCLSHANILSQLKLFDISIPFRYLSFSPIYWSTGLISTIMVAFRQSDTRITTCQPFTVELLVMLVKQYEINVFQAAPYQLTLLLQHPLLITSDFDQILMFFVLGGLVPESLRKDFRKAFPEHPLIIAYGMSEACICISSTGPTEAIEGLTVGRIFNNVQVKIIGKNNHVVDIGVTGEILAKPEFPFLGYYNNPEASKNAVDTNGFLKTGDVGFVDDSGCIVLIDRKKEIMKYKGYQINPQEIEALIESIEGVELASVVGIPDSICTNLSAAVVVKRPGFDDLTEQFIIDYVAEKEPEYKQLHGGVYFIDELPMTQSGQVQKRFVKVFAIREFNNRMDMN